jgi:hypothetical protein
MSSRSGLLLAFMGLLTLSATAPAQVQVDGSVSGSVVDSQGGTIPGAVVSLLLQGGKAPVLNSTTTAAGLFNLTGVRPDAYNLVVEASGFRVHTIEGIKVDPARETALPTITLEPATVNISVEVVAGTPTIQISSTEVSTTITNEQVRRLPVLDRYPLSLITTQAGVSAGAGPTVIDGQRTSSSTVTVDGINIQDNYIRDNALNYTPNLLALDQVAEFTVTTSNADATMGGGSSHVVFVTPSGTNTLHGSAYFYNRNGALAANSWFNNKDGLDRPSFNQNQIGGSLGGPILRDKLYFYTNYEAFRYSTDVSANSTILTADARGGVFTYEDTQNQVRKVDILQTAGVAADPAMQQILGQVPGPESINNFRVGDSRESLLRNAAGYAFLRRGFHNRDNATAKADYVLSTRNVFSGTFLWNRQDVTRSDLENDFSEIPKVKNDDSRTMVSVAWRWNPGHAFTNEVRGGFNLAPLTFSTSQDFGEEIISGMVYSNPVNLFRAQGRATDTYNLMENAHHVRGKHTLQFGFQLQDIRVETFDDAGITPTYFLGIGLGNPGLSAAQLPGVRSADLVAANNLLATLAGYVTGYSQTFNVTSRTSGFVSGARNLRHYSLNTYSLYLQDKWRLNPRLTLNFGLRYELPSVVDERDSLALLPVLQNGDPVATLLSNSTLDFAGSAAGRTWYRKDKNNIAPNFGFAWDIFGDSKTALRGAYGISYVNDEAIRAILNDVGFNEGLLAVSSRTGLSGQVGQGLPAVPVPSFKVPRTFADNYQLNPFTAFGLPDPELRTPYVQQWSLGIQREIKGTILEARYVGNHSTKMFRAYNLNPVELRANGFLDDFLRGRNNGNLARQATGVFDPNYNPQIPGSQPLVVFPTLVLGGLLNNPTVRSLIDTGEAGQLGFVYHINRLNGPVAFYQNPVSAASNTITNYSNVTYNAMQIDVQRRALRGLAFQANYTWARVLSDSNGTAQHRFEDIRDPRNGKIDRARPSFDITHAFKVNGVYDIPIGSEHRFSHPALNPILGGWSVSGIMTWQSGSPFSIMSRRGTLNSSYFSTENTASTTVSKQELDEVLKFRMTANGPYIVAASAIGSDGRGVAADGQAPFNGQVFSHPGPGEIGTVQQRWFSGPSTFNLDFALFKQFRIHEAHTLEFRMEALNIFNHPTWLVSDQDISSVRFGRVTSTFYGPRRIQLSLHYRF